jgi:ATP-dependent helicase HrpA
VRLDELERGPIDLSAAIDDARTQLTALVYDGSFSAQGTDRLTDINRYLEALTHRCAQLPVELRRDTEHRQTMHTLERDATGATDPAVVWMLQELRVSLWAQHLGTPEPISAKRIRERLS